MFNFANCQLNRTVVKQREEKYRLQMERYVQDIATYRKLHTTNSCSREKEQEQHYACARSFLVRSKNLTNVRLPLTICSGSRDDISCVLSRLTKEVQLSSYSRWIYSTNLIIARYLESDKQLSLFGIQCVGGLYRLNEEKNSSRHVILAYIISYDKIAERN